MLHKSLHEIPTREENPGLEEVDPDTDYEVGIPMLATIIEK